MLIPCAGLIHRRTKKSEMEFGPEVHSCGSISNGVSFDIGEGSWVIPFEALLEMARTAWEYRIFISEGLGKDVGK